MTALWTWRSAPTARELSAGGPDDLSRRGAEFAEKTISGFSSAPSAPLREHGSVPETWMPYGPFKSVSRMKSERGWWADCVHQTVRPKPAGKGFHNPCSAISESRALCARFSHSSSHSYSHSVFPDFRGRRRGRRRGRSGCGVSRAVPSRLCVLALEGFVTDTAERPATPAAADDAGQGSWYWVLPPAFW
jgi:hypothetical protein